MSIRSVMVATALFFGWVSQVHANDVDSSSVPPNVATDPGHNEDVFDILAEQENVMVSVSSRTEEKINETSSSVWVIDRPTIATSGALSVLDLLRRIPGFFILESGVGTGEIAPRGQTNEFNNYVLYLIDGRSVITPSTTSYEGFAFGLDIDDIERIEVVVGPASTIYGANAYSAVVNFITRKAPDKGYKVEARGEGGIGFASIDGNTPSPGVGKPLGTGFASFASAFGDWGLRLSVSGGAISGPTLLNQPQPYVGFYTPDQGSTRIGGLADLTHHSEHWDLRLRLQGVDAAGATYDETGEYETMWSLTGEFAALGKNLLAHDDQLTLQLWTTGMEDAETYPLTPQLAGIYTSNFIYSVSEILALYRTADWWHNRLTVGLQSRFSYTNVAGTSENTDPAARYVALDGVVAEDQFRPWQWLILTAGARLESRDSPVIKAFSKLTFAPRLAIVFVPSASHTIRLQYSTAFRNPSTLEGFATVDIEDGELNIIRPNYNILAEKNQMFSLGYQGHLSLLSLRAELFYGQKTDTISPESVSPTVPIPSEFQNVLGSDYLGGTLALEGKINTHFGFFGHYTYSETRERDPGQPIMVLPFPRHVAGVGADVHWRRFDGSLQVYYQSGSEQQELALNTPTYYSVAGHLMINPWLGYFVDEARRWQVFAAGTNVADLRFGGTILRDYATYVMARIGPRVYAGLRFNFGS